MIYTGLNRTGEIESVKAHGGADVAKVYGGIGENNPIFYSRKTLTGTSPLTFKGLGQPLTDYLISGNILQDGTPTPIDPVDVVGCGARTENLFDVADVILGYHIGTNGAIEPRGNRMCTAHSIDLTGISNITLSFQTSISRGVSAIFALYSAGVLVSRMASVRSGDSIDVSNGDSCLIAFYSNESIEVNTQNTTNIMLNTGTAPLTYEPYGYKIPLTISNGSESETTPVYIGNDQIMQGEYVSFAEQKIYRYVNGVLTPTDPPVPLPIIRTLTGTNILTVGTAVQPSEVSITGNIKEVST